MQVLVTGGTGTLGRKLVPRLVAAGHEVRVLSRRPGTGRVVGDLATGAGLDAAVRGMDVVIDAANAAGLSATRSRAVLVDGTRRLGAAAAEAGVRHHVLISIVGIDDVPMPYYRVKVEQEAVLRAGPLPWTLLRATQFHPLVAWVIAAAAKLPVLPLPDIPVQPVSPGEVADALVRAAQEEAAGRLSDFGGPEVIALPEAGRQWLAARHRRRAILRPPLPGRVGSAVRRGALTTPDRAAGTVRFADWLRERPQ